MKTYREFSPSAFDARGLGLPDMQDWFVAPVAQNRDSEALDRSNFRVVLKDLKEHGRADTEDNYQDVQVRRFGHWANGWFEIILVRPETPAAKCAEEWEGTLSDYPVACDVDFYDLQSEDALATWQNCYRRDRDRLEYISSHRGQFGECFSKHRQPLEAWRNLLANVRGKQFSGEASELLS